MHTDEDYIIAARALRPNLATLVGAAIAQDLEPHLATILDQEITDPTAAADALETLFAQNPEADQQFKRYLNELKNSTSGGWIPIHAVKDVRGDLFQNLPGDPSLPPAKNYRCPEPDCNFTCSRRDRLCPTHSVPVIKQDRTP